MRQLVAAAVVGAMALGCGPGIRDADGNAPPCSANCGPVEAARSLSPLEEGRFWRYKITEDQRGVFEKRVTVLGTAQLEGFDGPLVKVRSVQPHLEEVSYQLDDGKGIIWRLREDDFRNGVQIRALRWFEKGTTKVSGIVKSLSLKPDKDGWSHTVAVTERVEYFDGAPAEHKDKSYTWQVLGTETVTVPAGTFETVKVRRVRADKEKRDRVYWLAPGVGKVREEGERLEELVETGGGK